MNSRSVLTNYPEKLKCTTFDSTAIKQHNQDRKARTFTLKQEGQKFILVCVCVLFVL